MRDPNAKVFIRVAREGEFAAIEGWYEPVENSRNVITTYEHESRMANLRESLKTYVDQWNRELDKNKTLEANNKFLCERIAGLERDLQQSNDIIRKIESIVVPF